MDSKKQGLFKLFNKLIKYDFKLSRGNNTVSQCLDNHLREYINDLKEYTNDPEICNKDKFKSILNDKIQFIEDSCNKLLEVLELYRNGRIRKSYEKSEEFFENLSEYFFINVNYKDNDYYRIRKGDFRIREGEDNKDKKSELFHIKNNKRNLINSYRYSISGFPCLYVSEGFELAWFECGMPSQFSYCKMELDKKRLRLLDFSENPYNLKVNINNELISYPDKEKIYRKLLNYIITYPIAISCSLKVEKRDDAFVEEYIIPQMLMQWIRNSNKFDGIIYKSSLNTTLIEGIYANNIVLPTKEFRDSGLDKGLTENIKVSDIGYFDVNKHFEDYRINLDELQEFKQELLNKPDHFAYSYIMNKIYVREIIEMCDNINTIYGDLIMGNYSNLDLIFHSINCIYSYIYRFKNSKENIYEEFMTYINNNKSMCCDIDENSLITEIENDINKFYDISSQIVKMDTAFDFKVEELTNFEKI